MCEITAGKKEKLIIMPVCCMGGTVFPKYIREKYGNLVAKYEKTCERYKKQPYRLLGIIHTDKGEDDGQTAVLCFVVCKNKKTKENYLDTEALKASLYLIGEKKVENSALTYILDRSVVRGKAAVPVLKEMVSKKNMEIVRIGKGAGRN